MVFSSGPETRMVIYINDVPQIANIDKYSIQVVDGRITGDISKLDIKSGDKVALEISFGGLMIKSDNYRTKGASAGYIELAEVTSDGDCTKAVIGSNTVTIPFSLTDEDVPAQSYSGKAVITFPVRCDKGSWGEATFDVVYDTPGTGNPVGMIAVHEAKPDGGAIFNYNLFQGQAEGATPLHGKLKIDGLGSDAFAWPEFKSGDKLISYVVWWGGSGDAPSGNFRFTYKIMK